MDFTNGFTGETTGRSLVLFADGAGPAGRQAVQEAIGAEMVDAAGLHDDGPAGGGVFFPALGVAVVDSPPEQVARAGVSAAGSATILAVESERVVHALEAATGARTDGNAALPAALPPGATPVAQEAPPYSAEYLRGFRAAVLHLTGGEPPAGAARAQALDAALDESQATWGLQVTKVVNCCRTGLGVRVAVLDTGFDEQHPDFAGRAITTRSFIPGEAVRDGHGHGTHCIGTALGPRCPGTRPRYGVAHEAEIFAGKVLSDAGSGTDTQILAGIEWALQNGCAVISMSLGAATRPGQPFSQIFERVARRAQDQGTLIVAAAGNESDRPGVVNPVGHPANCPSIMAVGAIDAQIAIAPFSNRGINPDGGQVDIVGPGVDIHSTWPMPTRYRRISGTSMATPHVAGIAALFAEEDPTARGAALGRLLAGGAQRLALPSEDVGAGLVQAP